MQLNMNHNNNSNHLNDSYSEEATNNTDSAPYPIRSHVGHPDATDNTDIIINNNNNSTIVLGDYIDSNGTALVPHEMTSIVGLQLTVQDSPHRTIDEFYSPQLLPVATVRFESVEQHPDSLLSMYVPYNAADGESLNVGSMTTCESDLFLFGSSTIENRSMQHTTRLVDIIDEAISIYNNSEEHLL